MQNSISEESSGYTPKKNRKFEIRKNRASKGYKRLPSRQRKSSKRKDGCRNPPLKDLSRPRRKQISKHNLTSSKISGRPTLVKIGDSKGEPQKAANSAKSAEKHLRS